MLPSGHTLTTKGETGGRVVLAISGRLSLENLQAMMSETGPFFDVWRPSELTVDLSGVDYMDSSGALLLLEMEQRAKSRSIPFTLTNVSDKEKGVIDLLDASALTVPPLIPKERSMNVVEQVGDGCVRMYNDLVEIVTFGGELVVDLISSFLRPLSVRWGDVLSYMKKVGVDGLPILGLISFLLGLIMAFMSSLQLKQFGANVYVASLVSIAMVKELGPIMTAIIVAGRSGSAFAAEIGTMKVDEEVDALVTMGFNPMRFLAIPKVLAAIFVFPLLTLFADLFAIAGGMVVGVLGLDLTVYTYVQETLWGLTVSDIIMSMIKSIVFAVFIAGIGCMRGFQVRGGAEAVGNATTSAVVSSLFLIIVIDSIFAIVLNYIG
jgi:phospholipid/cholesterol/gamma-HCH transport system permease protein